MPDNNGIPEIATGSFGAFGQQLNVVANVDPDQFPHGLEFIIMVPGQIEPFGRMVCKPGAMLVDLPLEVAAHIRKEIRKQVARIEAGQVAAPGFH